MSREKLAVIDFRSGRIQIVRRARVRENASMILRNIKLEREQIKKVLLHKVLHIETIHHIKNNVTDSLMLDVMQKTNRIIDSIKREKLIRKCFPSTAGADKASLPNHPAAIRTSATALKTKVFSENICPKKKHHVFKKDATVKQGNQVLVSPLLMAVYLRRNWRYRRKRICELWIAPWKLNSAEFSRCILG